MGRAKRGTVGAIAPWAGSKRTMADRVVELLDDHDQYGEPFCGSAAVLLAKPRVAHETINDLHGDVVNVAAVLASKALAPELLWRLHATIASEHLWREAARHLDTPFTGTVGCDATRAYHALVYWWLGRNGTAGSDNGGGFCARFSASGSSGAVRWRSLVASVPAFSERLQGVEVLNRDGFGVLDSFAKHDRPGLALYVDPPYLRKSIRYTHDFAAEDHTRLADSLARFTRARVVVSYYAEPELSELYPADRWRRIDVEATKNMSNTGTGGRTAAPEVLLVNRRVSR